MSDRTAAVAALAEALCSTDIANVAFVGDEDDHPTDAESILSALDANPTAKAALAAYLSESAPDPGPDWRAMYINAAKDIGAICEAAGLDGDESVDEIVAALRAQGAR